MNYIYLIISIIIIIIVLYLFHKFMINIITKKISEDADRKISEWNLYWLIIRKGKK